MLSCTEHSKQFRIGFSKIPHFFFLWCVCVCALVFADFNCAPSSSCILHKLHHQFRDNHGLAPLVNNLTGIVELYVGDVNAWQALNMINELYRMCKLQSGGGGVDDQLFVGVDRIYSKKRDEFLVAIVMATSERDCKHTFNVLKLKSSITDRSFSAAIVNALTIISTNTHLRYTIWRSRMEEVLAMSAMPVVLAPNVNIAGDVSMPVAAETYATTLDVLAPMDEPRMICSYRTNYNGESVPAMTPFVSSLYNIDIEYHDLAPNLGAFGTFDDLVAAT